MSYYDQQTPEALWGIAMERMAKSPLPVNRAEATSYLENRRAVGTIKPPCATSQASRPDHGPYAPSSPPRTSTSGSQTTP